MACTIDCRGIESGCDLVGKTAVDFGGQTGLEIPVVGVPLADVIDGIKDNVLYCDLSFYGKLGGLELYCDLASSRCAVILQRGPDLITVYRSDSQGCEAVEGTRADNVVVGPSRSLENVVLFCGIDEDVDLGV